MASDTVALIGGTIIDGRGGPPIENGVVITADERIEAVGSAASVAVPENARRIDATGMTLMPGLADMHVHFLGGWDGVAVEMLGYQRYLNALLYAGVLTIFDTGNVMPYILQIRNEVAAGTIPGPRIYSVGALIDGPDPVWPPISIPLSSRSQVSGVVGQLERAGVDAVKIYVGVSVPLISEIAREAHERSLPVIVDVWDRNGSYDVAATGITAFAHLPRRTFDDRTLGHVVENKIRVISTLATMESFARRRFDDLGFLDHPLVAATNPPAFDRAFREYASRDLSAEETARAKSSRERLDIAMQAARQLREAGGTLVVGTDAPYPGVLYGEGVHRELELLVEAGFTPLEAISAATRDAAGLMNAEDWGTLEPGKVADLVVVEGRPDRNIADTRAIRYVMQSGRLLDRSALELDLAKDPGFRAGSSVDGGR